MVLSTLLTLLIAVIKLHELILIKNINSIAKILFCNYERQLFKWLITKTNCIVIICQCFVVYIVDKTKSGSQSTRSLRSDDQLTCQNLLDFLIFIVKKLCNFFFTNNIDNIKMRKTT